MLYVLGWFSSRGVGRSLMEHALATMQASKVASASRRCSTQSRLMKGLASIRSETVN